MNPVVPPMAQETTPETSRTPAAAAGPHHSRVSRRSTFVFFYCGVCDGHWIDVFVTGMFSLCLSDHPVCVLQRVFLSFVASARRMWTFFFLAKQTNDTVVVVVNKAHVVYLF